MKKIFMLILALFALISCGEKTSANSEATASSQIKKRDILNVTASIPPQAFIIKSVGKDKVKVNVMLPPSSAPETYEPGPQKMADLKDSTVYFKGGLPFEGFFLERLAKDYKNVRFADMMKGINFRKMEGHFHPHHHCDKGCAEACADCKCGCKEGRECGCRHGEKLKKEECGEDACALPGLEEPKAEEEKHEHHHHDGMHEHHHEGKHEDCPHYKEHHGKHPFPPMPGHFPEMHDPHVWLDPMNLVVMTDNTVAELSEVDPDNAAFYRENGEALKAEIKKVNDEVAAQLKDVEGKSFVVHHPAFGYFAERFGLKQVQLEIEGKEPGAVDMAKVVDFIKKNNAKAVFMQAQIPDSVIKSVAEETKVRVITLDPLKENVLENIRETASEIKGALVDEK